MDFSDVGFHQIWFHFQSNRIAQQPFKTNQNDVVFVVLSHGLYIFTMFTSLYNLREFCVERLATTL